MSDTKICASEGSTGLVLRLRVVGNIRRSQRLEEIAEAELVHKEQEARALKKTPGGLTVSGCSEKHGLGLFATREFAKGDVVHYNGELIDRDEELRRENVYGEIWQILHLLFRLSQPKICN